MDHEIVIHQFNRGFLTSKNDEVTIHFQVVLRRRHFHDHRGISNCAQVLIKVLSFKNLLSFYY